MRVGWALLLSVAACPQQVGFITHDPASRGAGHGEVAPPPPVRTPAAAGGQLEEDEQVVEPDHPAVKTPQERALVHVHTPSGACSGMLVAPRLVATAHQCFPHDVAGVHTVGDKERDDYKVEVASSTLTWTLRRIQAVVVPACEWKVLDLAVVVLDEAAPSAPVAPVSAPAPGARVQALGFGRCRGDTAPFSGRTGSVLVRRDTELVVDVLLCHGDAGGAVLDTGAGGYLGVISHRGEAPPGATIAASIVRFDTQRARELLAAAEAVVKGQAPWKPVACN